MNVGLKKYACLGSVWLAVLGRSSGALDLTPRFVEREINGIQSERPYFCDGTTRYTVNLPVRTTVCADNGGARFMFSEPEGATFAMRLSPQKPSVRFEGADLAVYRETALRFVAAHVKDVRIQKEEANAFSVNNSSSYRFTISSSLPGIRITQQITFLNLNAGQQIVLITTADSSNFKRAAEKAYQIMNSFHSIPADRDLSAPVFP